MSIPANLDRGLRRKNRKCAAMRQRIARQVLISFGLPGPVQWPAFIAIPYVDLGVPAIVRKSWPGLGKIGRAG